MRHDKKHWGKRSRADKRESKQRKKAMRDEMRARDAEVTARWGRSAHIGCGSKYRYSSEEEATSVAAKRIVHGADILRVYKCPYCDGWHLTSH